MTFTDRADAGRRLAALLLRTGQLSRGGVVVLGLPRGGVPVAYEVARALGAPLDVLVVRKLGVPYMPELAVGAIGEGGVRVVNEDVVTSLGVSPATIAEVENTERPELARRLSAIRARFPQRSLAGAVAVIVDDGVATGATAAAACAVARAHGATRVVLAAPVMSADSATTLAAAADTVVAVDRPKRMSSIGRFYDDFAPVPEAQVLELLEKAAGVRPAASTGGAAPSRPLVRTPLQRVVPLRDDDAEIPYGAGILTARLTVPAHPAGVVVFAHGGGSGRASPRNTVVADALVAAGLATLLVDLRTESEHAAREFGFDVALLSERVLAAMGWLRAEHGLGGLPIGIFGSGTGAAVALWAAAELAAEPVALDRCAGVVSRGGRIDLAEARLGEVLAPTMLLVGGADEIVLDVNRRFQPLLGGPSRLVVVPGATHLFGEPGALEQVSAVAAAWFRTCFSAPPHPPDAAGRPRDV